MCTKLLIVYATGKLLNKDRVFRNNTDKHNKNIIFIETKSIKKKEFITLVYKAYSSYKEQLKTYIPAILKKQYCLKEKSYNIDKLAEIIMCATDEEWNLVKDTGIGFYIIDRTM